MTARVLSREKAAALVRELRATGNTIVFTNGVFDLLHPGHVRYLRAARKEGDALDRRRQFGSLGAREQGTRPPGHSRGPSAPSSSPALARRRCQPSSSTRTRRTTSSRPCSRMCSSKAPTGPPMPIVGTRRRRSPRRTGRPYRRRAGPLTTKPDHADANGRLTRSTPNLHLRNSQQSRKPKAEGQRAIGALGLNAAARSYTGGFTMSTTTSLTLRALLKDARGPHGPRRARRRRHGAVAVCAGAGARGVWRTPSPERLVVAIVAERRGRGAPHGRRPRFFSGAIEGLAVTRAADALVLPFPSHEVDPYRGLAPHLRVASARARALYGAASGRGPVVIASAAAVLPRSARRSELLNAVAASRSRAEILRREDLAELLALMPGSRAKTPLMSTASSASAAASSTSFPPDAAEPFRIEFIGDTIEIDPPLRSRHAALHRARSTRSLSSRCARRSTATRRAPGATAVFDHFFAGQAAAVRRRGARRVTCGRGEASSSRWRRATKKPPPDAVRRPGAWRCRSGLAVPRLGHRRTASSRPRPGSSSWRLRGAQQRAAAGPRLRARATSRCQPAVEFRGRDAGLDRRDSATRENATRRSSSSPKHPAVPSACSRSPGTTAWWPRRSTARKTRMPRRCSSDSAACRGGSGCRTGRLVLYAETDVFEEERHAPERRAATGACVPLGPARPEGRRSRSSTWITASACSSA